MEGLLLIKATFDLSFVDFCWVILRYFQV